MIAFSASPRYDRSMNRAIPVAAPAPVAVAPVSRPTLVEYFLLLVGCALSFYLITLDHPKGQLGAVAAKQDERYLGHLKVEPASSVTSPALRFLVLTLPDLMRLPEGIILLWPLLHGIQRIMGRREGLTSAEWLWVFSWLGTALITGMALWTRFGSVPEWIATHASWPPVVWYVILVPSMALIAGLILLFGLLGRWQLPWTHNFGLVLIIWPALPLAAILTLGKYAWSAPS